MIRQNEVTETNRTAEAGECWVEEVVLYGSWQAKERCEQLEMRLRSTPVLATRLCPYLA